MSALSIAFRSCSVPPPSDLASLTIPIAERTLSKAVLAAAKPSSQSVGSARPPIISSTSLWGIFVLFLLSRRAVEWPRAHHLGHSRAYASVALCGTLMPLKPAGLSPMLRTCSRVIALTAMVAYGLVTAGAADVDWKMYGTASVEGGSVCFYDANIIRTPGLRVWTKCLLQKDMDALDADSEIGKKIVESAARKVVDGYIPPLAVLEDISFDQAIGVIQYEETAKLSGIQPHARFFYELNCSERMMRRLSTYVRIKGRDSFNDNPSSWEYVPPEGTGATLLKILCPKP